MKYLLSLLLLSVFTEVSAYNHQSLNSIDGQHWQMFAATDTQDDGELISISGWTGVSSLEDAVAGIVPGTAFAAYVAAGREPDPNFGDNIYNVDETKYNVDHWYRTVFDKPKASRGHHTILTFEGINRTASIYLNGTKLGTIHGHVMKTHYDITSLLKDKANCLAVRVEMMRKELLPRNSNFVNYCCPTYIASHSWDWMPYVPGLNTGITNDVYLDFVGDVTIRDPWIKTCLTDNYRRATVSPETSLVNLSGSPRTVTVKAVITPGKYKAEQTVTIAPGDSVTIGCGDIFVDEPRLWWPNGYGEPNLYSCRLEVEENGHTLDTMVQPFGIREYKYRKENTALVVYVNGKKIFCKGGNWGMSEYMLRQDKSEYDLRCMLHKEMHFNMIRSWTGCVTDEEFYDACDKYGIMVWDDFWLTGPYVGLTGPDDKTEFLANARDKVVRLRNHPCEAIWCADNEGWPYDELNDGLRDIVAQYDGRLYMPNSHNGYYTNKAYEAKDDSGYGLSGSGWWMGFWPEDYFDDGIGAGGGDKGDCVDWGFRTELGSGAFDTYESTLEFTPTDSLWPRNGIWEKHFFSDAPAYGGAAQATDYYNKVEEEFGPSCGLEEFCEKAQLRNIETARASFEGWNSHLWDDATGLLYWMSQAAYPSHLWQTYDYYYDMTGVYWGARKACEPIHIQWNCDNDDLSIINTSLKNYKNMKAEVETFTLDGVYDASLSGWYENLSVGENSTLTFANIEKVDSFFCSTRSDTGDPVFFLRLTLSDEDGKRLSENFYIVATEKGKHDYKVLNTLPEADVQCAVLSKKTDKEGWCHMKVLLTNHSSTVAFAERLRMVDANGKRVLPLVLDDNYITIMPGEQREVEMRYNTTNVVLPTRILLKQYHYLEK